MPETSFNLFDYLKKRVNSPTNLSSRCEFRPLGPIAEPLCALSSIPMFAAAFYHRDYALMFIAIATALSHAIPKQGLHDLDMLGHIIIPSRLIYKFYKSNDKMFILNNTFQNKRFLMVCAAGLAANLLDTQVGRKHPESVGPLLHAVWHCMIAYVLHQADNAIDCPNPGKKSP